MWLLSTCDLFVISYIWDFWLLVQEGPKTPFSLKVAQNIFISKFNLKPVADIVFDLRNEFHANRMCFGVLGVKSFKRLFWPILNPLILKIVNFAQNKSSRAGKSATSLFLYGESEKIGPETICRPPRFQVLRILLTFSLNSILINS